MMSQDGQVPLPAGRMHGRHVRQGFGAVRCNQFDVKRWHFENDLPCPVL